MKVTENTIDRARFFPDKRSGNINQSNIEDKLSRNNDVRANELKGLTAKDAKVQISDKVKDFARIKKAVDLAKPAAEMDNSEKIAKLKDQIENGTYQVNYDAIADKLLSREL